LRKKALAMRALPIGTPDFVGRNRASSDGGGDDYVVLSAGQLGDMAQAIKNQAAAFRTLRLSAANTMACRVSSVSCVAFS
jgi:hypothetical protein